MGEFFLQGQKGKTYFNLPSGWNVLNQTEIGAQATNEPVSALVEKALTRPIGTVPLAEIVKGKATVAIIVDDPARPTPKNALLTPLLEYLNRSGVSNDRVSRSLSPSGHTRRFPKPR